MNKKTQRIFIHKCELSLDSFLIKFVHFKNFKNFNIVFNTINLYTNNNTNNTYHVVNKTYNFINQWNITTKNTTKKQNTKLIFYKFEQHTNNDN